MIRRLRYALQTGALRAVLALARVAPRAALRAMGAAAGSLGYALDARHRGIATDNLLAAFPQDLDRRGARRILRRCWRHFGRITFETFALPRLGRDDLGGDVEIVGAEHLERALAGGRGVLIFSAHFGHWELAAYVQGLLGHPLSLVARPLDNPGLERLLAGVRTGTGNRIVYKRNAVRDILRVLRGGGCVGIMIDQDARDGGVFVPFFGRLASTTPTLASLALRTGAAVIPGRSIALGGGRYRVTWDPPVAFEPTGDREADVVALTALCTRTIEDWVRRHPDQWLWMHRRWKTPPPG